MAIDPRACHDNYYAFLIRVSRADASRSWETVAKDLTTGDEHTFADPEALLRFLSDRLPRTAPGCGKDSGGVRS